MEIERLFDQLPLPPSGAQQEQLLYFLDQLLLWNRSYNLTAITERNEAFIKHLLDSLVIAPHLQQLAPDRVLDVGSGAGLPGIPLAIVLPEISFTLLDSSGKRVRFMRQMQMELKLSNINIVKARVQEYQHEDGFNIIMSRAFASGVDMVRWSEHLLAAEGRYMAMKGLYLAKEWEGLPHYHKAIVPLEVPMLDEERHLVFLQRDTEEV